MIRLFFILMVLSASALSQGNDYFLTSSDNEIAIEVSRNQEGVNITLSFRKASQYDFVLIEKSSNSISDFSQCKYIRFSETNKDSVVITKRDVYPLAASQDVYYRVKTVTREGVTRAYPAVRLPAVQDDKKRNY